MNYTTNEKIDSALYNNIVITGEIVIQPEFQDKNIMNHIVRKCREKYSNKVIEVEKELHVILNVSSIDTTKLSNKVLRNNNECSTMYFTQMNCTVFKPVISQNLVCKVNSINTDFIEAQLTLSGTPVLFLIMIDESNISSNFKLSDNIIHIGTNKQIKQNDLIVINVDSIIQNTVNLIIFGKLLDLA